MLWRVWNEAWKARNKKFNEENRYLAQTAKMQRIVNINIIYHCREHLFDELNRQLQFSVKEHLSQSNVLIDEWLLMLKSILHQDVIKKNEKIWREAETDFFESIQ
jgi:hypothetical protein